jgi:EAL domain-containing protein (putative c-di-GMP-specific phosphodiesterase class I)
MHELARSLGMRSVAEYVETEAVREMLCTLGIDYGQGYAIHAPCRIDTLAAPPVAVTVDDDGA